MAGPESEDGDDPLVGKTLGGSYEIVRVVGEGGMGTVYEAKHRRITTRRFAVKTLHPEYLRDPGAVTRFKREAEAAASISSAHVAGVFDVGTTADGAPYIVGELLDGEDLGDLLERVGRLPVGAMVRIVRQVCKGLAAAHACGVVHRDIKPDNLFLTGDPARPTARVLDFGISRLDTGGTKLTKTGMIMGTPAYMAPEQARGHNVDERADIYALGAVLYRGLTGQVPFDKPDPSAMIAAVLLEEPVPARSLEPSIDESLDLIIQRAMTKDPAERYPSIEAFDDALARYDTLDEAMTMVVAAVGTAPALRSRSRSQKSVSGEARDVLYARPLLVSYALLASCALLMGMWTMAGVMAAFIRGGAPEETLTTAESGLTVLTLSLVAATPGFLFVRHLRSVWQSTMKVLRLLSTLRVAVFAALLTYGAMWLVVRAQELAVLRHQGGAAWPGWDILLLVSAVGAAVFAARREGRDNGAQGAAARPATFLPPTGWAVAALVMLVASGLVGTLRGDVVEGSAAASDDEEEGGSRRSRRRGDSEDRRDRQLATPAVLASARAGGVEALRALEKRHPEDPAVLEALALSESRAPKGRPAALKTVKRLLATYPGAANNVAIQKIVREAASGAPAERDLALELMGREMGARGPDLLYELSGTAKLKAKADAWLAKEGVKKLASPALRLALDLRAQKGCPEAALLERAGRDGDKRALTLLQPLAASRSYKCGFMGLKTCHSPARCAAQANAIRQAMFAIQKRSAE